MFDRKRSQMSVRDDIAMRTGKREKFAQNLRVPFGRQRYPCRLAREPCLYLPPRISMGSGYSNTRGLVTSRRKASMLAQGRPTGPEPFNC